MIATPEQRAAIDRADAKRAAQRAAAHARMLAIEARLRQLRADPALFADDEAASQRIGDEIGLCKRELQPLRERFSPASRIPPD